jgi:potassium-transporting ATPase KdpC subunit
MLAQLRAAVVMLLALTVITGVVYPFLITGIAQAAFPRPANGSLIERGGKVVGSSLIGQPFDDPKYFWGRLSATTDANGKGLPYNGGSSVGSNLGPTNPALTDAAKARIDALHGVDPGAQGPIPVDLVTASGSGLDPHISPAAALYQVPRVAKARGVVERRLRELVLEHTEGRSLLVMGEPGVNVLELNLALDAR